MILSDEPVRKEALNPRISAIVQAPAGSGKTELLTQRFLNLLCTVEAPEQIIALTFTRKAAHEMQARILARLAHHEAALARDKAYDWQLLKNPTRLRVTTIDSLCYNLTRSILSKTTLSPPANITDAPNILYWQAARACFQHAIKNPPYQEAISTLLRHLDNRVDILLELFTDQLAKRDQWLRPVYQARLQSKAHLESALKRIEQHAIEQFIQSIPKLSISPLITLAAEIAKIENNPDSPRYPLQFLSHIQSLTREQALGLASLILTKNNQCRQSFDHHVGLKRDYCSAAHYQSLKTASKSLLETLAACEPCIEALKRINMLPDPTYPDAQWEGLQALFMLLPLLAAHLELVFASTKTIDFTAVTHQALESLGDDDHPTDLSLYLDYHLKHLLVDEFQDTSLQQFEFISRLIRGFEPGDGRTVFLVGDPMQSIYRFRAAEVGLFMRAQQQGIANLSLKSLFLEVNFRSHAPIIAWINQHIAALFPSKNDLESGAVSFHSSIAVKGSEDSLIQAIACENEQSEANAIATLCQELLSTYPQDTLAILVRTRGQLAALTEALDQHQIPYEGLDTHRLINLQHVKDVWSVTQALLMPANRLAWLAMLRSPYGGLSLEDIHLIANHAPLEGILTALGDPLCIQKLTLSGQRRAQYLYHIFKKALDTRCQDTLIDWLFNTLQALHLDHILTAEARETLEPFFDKLAQFEQNGLLSEIALFEAELEKIYSKKSQPARLQLMTIHKAKGLEFDSVILPGLGKRAKTPEKPLLRWLTLPAQNTEDLILISPFNTLDAPSAALYDYLGQIDGLKNHYEQQRLFYVAVTRAKKRLYLFDGTSSTSQHTFRGYLKSYPFESESVALTKPQKSMAYPPRIYLPDTFYSKQVTVIHEPTRLNPARPLAELSHARALGIITHELLEWICTYHPTTPSEIPWQLVIASLESVGLPSTECEKALDQIKTWIKRMFHHPKGQWIIQKHQQEKNEYELLVSENHRVNTRIIDRVFVENGICWLIDFKTGQKHPKQHQQYQQQLNQYASNMAVQTSLPIYCGLYYIEAGLWVEWTYSPLTVL